MYGPNKQSFLNNKPQDEWAQSKSVLMPNTGQPSGEFVVAKLRKPFEKLKRLQELTQDTATKSQESMLRHHQKLPTGMQTTITHHSIFLRDTESTDLQDDLDWTDLPWTNHSKLSSKMNPQ